MFYEDPRKKMVERPKNEPRFNSKNKTDKTIALLVVFGLLIVGIFATLAILLFFFLKHG